MSTVNSLPADQPYYGEDEHGLDIVWPHGERIQPREDYYRIQLTEDGRRLAFNRSAMPYNRFHRGVYEVSSGFGALILCGAMLLGSAGVVGLVASPFALSASMALVSVILIGISIAIGVVTLLIGGAIHSLLPSRELYSQTTTPVSLLDDRDPLTDDEFLRANHVAHASRELGFQIFEGYVADGADGFRKQLELAEEKARRQRLSGFRDDDDD